MFIDESLFDLKKHSIEFLDGLIITSDQLLFHKCELIRKVLENFNLVVFFCDLSAEHFLSWKKTLILLYEMMPGMVDNTLNANVFLITLTKELEGFIMLRAELIILSYLFFLTGQL